MPATQYELLIEQGSDVNVVCSCVDVTTGAVFNLSGWTARMQFRLKPKAPSILLTVTPEVNGPNGQVTVYIPASTTSAITWRQAVYDVEITDGSQTHRILQGMARVSPEITR